MSEVVTQPAQDPPTLAIDPGSNDYDLVVRLANGDHAAFADVYGTHQRAMVRLARVYVGSEAAAEDVAQETWIAVMRGIAKFEGRSSLKNWIFRILTNRAKTRAVKDGRQLPFSSFEGAGDRDLLTVDASWFQPDGNWVSIPRRWENDTPEKLTSAAETVEMIRQEIEKLPSKERTVVQLRDMQDWTSKEVCNVLEISEVYQRVLLHRGRSKIRHALDAYLHGNGAS